MSEPAGQPGDGQRVPVHAEPHDDAGGHGGEVGVLPELLARVHVRHVHLHDRHVRARDRVPQRHRRVRVGAGVQHHADDVPGGVAAARLLHPVDELALVVALPGLHLQAVAVRLLPAEGLHVRQRRRPVDRRLPGAQQVQVRAVEHEHGAGVGHVPTVTRRSWKDRRMELTWPGVLAWPLRRRFLLPDAGSSAPDAADRHAIDVVRRLAGVQAQVMSAAEQAVAVRTRTPRPGALAQGLAHGELVRTWAMRGTLHVLPADELGTYLAPLAAARTWQKGSWQRTFLDAAGMRVLTDAVRELLDGGAVLTREELTGAVVAG